MKCVGQRRDMQMTCKFKDADVERALQLQQHTYTSKQDMSAILDGLFHLSISDFTLEVIFLMSMSWMLFSYFFASLVHFVSSIAAMPWFLDMFQKRLASSLLVPSWDCNRCLHGHLGHPGSPNHLGSRLQNVKTASMLHFVWYVCYIPICQMTTKATLYLMQCRFLQHKCTYQSGKITVNGVWFNIVRWPNSKRWPLLI